MRERVCSTPDTASRRPLRNPSKPPREIFQNRFGRVFIPTPSANRVKWMRLDALSPAPPVQKYEPDAYSL